MDKLSLGGRLRQLWAWGASALVAAAVAVPGLTVSRPLPAGAPGFGHEVIVDHQRLAGEPSTSVSPVTNSAGYRDIYISAPYGFSTTASFIWKSEDGGQTFHLIGGQVPPGGKPNTCAGGGDSSIVNNSAGNLYFADLQGLTEVSASVSTNGANSFTSTCFAANNGNFPVDRPWLSTYGDPLTTGREYLTVDQTEACTVNCGLGQAGSNLVELTQASGLAASTQTFTPLPPQEVEPDGIISGTVVNQSNRDLYLVHTGFTDATGKITGGGDANGNDNAIVVDRFPGGYAQSTATPIPPTSVSVCAPYNTATRAICDSDTVFHAPLATTGNSSVTVGQDFSPMAIDRAGDLYVAWSQASVDPSTGSVNGPSTIYMATSTNQGATWSNPIVVSTHVAGLGTSVFPSIAAGSTGRVDVVWYGTTTLGSCPSQPCGPSAINGSWNVYMAQTLNAVTSGKPNASPTFATTQVNEVPAHYGAICTFGISCTTGGDRGLLDFLSVVADPSGAADVSWANSANTNYQNSSSTLAEPQSSAVVVFAKQVSGPGLYGSAISGPVPLLNSAAGSADSYFAGNGAETAAPANSNVDIVSSSIAADPGKDSDGDNDNYLLVTMKVGSLSSLLVPSLGTDADHVLIWLTRWEVPVASPSVTDQGHFFYAAMESDNGAAPTFYDGETVCGVFTDHCKDINYPPGHTITGSYTTSGTITLLVPRADLPSVKVDQKLFSVTGLTATEATPATTGTALFNVINSTPPYDAKPH